MRCPVCRADNNEGPECRRCRADLSWLWDLERQRRRLLGQAADCAGDNDWNEVIRLAGKAHSLRRDADSHRMLAVGHFMQRHFAEALNYYRQAKNF